MKEEKVPKVPYSVLAYVTNSSIRTIRAVQNGERNDRRNIKLSKERIENFLRKLKAENQ